MEIKITWFKEHWVGGKSRPQVFKVQRFANLEEAKAAILNPILGHRHEGNLKRYQIRKGSINRSNKTIVDSYEFHHYRHGDSIKIESTDNLYSFANGLFSTSNCDEIYEPNHNGYWCVSYRDNNFRHLHRWRPNLKKIV